MGKKWTAYFEIGGDESSIFDTMEFDVTEEQYEEIVSAVENRIPIKELDFYDELIENVEESIDLAEFCLDEDADEEDLEEWEDFCEDYWIADVTIDDPGDLQRLKNEFIGMPLEKNTSFDIEENAERIVYYKVKLITENGKITDLSVDADALISDGIRGGGLSPCYPKYDLLCDELKVLLSEYEG